MTRILLTLVLAAYNNIANAWPPFNRAAYVPTNILFTVTIALAAFGPLELSFDEVVGELRPGAALLGVALGGLLASPLFVATRWPRWRARMADKRLAHLAGAGLAYQCLVRVPAGTALPEEFVFRGVAFVAWAETTGTPGGALISSCVFGLWHIGPARNAVLANRPSSTTATLARAIVATMLATALAGLVLVWLRTTSGGLLLPFALHATLNSLATLAAARAHRLTDSSRR